MSGDKYFIQNQQDSYFLTLTVVKWVDLFSRKEYRDILVDSLNYCIQHKGLELYAWVVMSNHLHLAARCQEPFRLSDFLRDFKKFTSKKFIDKIHEIPESRREWLLNRFSFEARRTNRADHYKIWTDDNHAIDLSTIDVMQKVNYIHENPVRAGLVNHPEHYIYSSAIDYVGGKGLVEVIVV